MLTTLGGDPAIFGPVRVASGAGESRDGLVWLEATTGEVLHQTEGHPAVDSRSVRNQAISSSTIAGLGGVINAVSAAIFADDLGSIAAVDLFEPYPTDRYYDSPSHGRMQAVPSGRGTVLMIAGGRLVELDRNGIVASVEHPTWIRAIDTHLVRWKDSWLLFANGRLWEASMEGVVLIEGGLADGAPDRTGPYVLEDGSVIMQSTQRIDRRTESDGTVWRMRTPTHWTMCSELVIHDEVMWIFCNGTVYRWHIGLNLALGISRPGFDNGKSHAVWE